MQFPESWLRAFCNPPLATAQLAELLTMSGMEVEETRPVAPPFANVVVAKVLDVQKHPQADRLSVCTVDAGTGAALQIVCGAPNVKPGIKVPCALVGAVLPPVDDEKADGKPFEIRLGTLRGVESQGMLCSARELKLSEDHGGLLVLADDAPVGVDIRRHLALDDTLFTLKLTPNLGHVLSVYGVAREVSALTGVPLTLDPIVPVAPTDDAKLAVKVEAPDLCGRFSGRVIRHVDTTAKTPQWMVDRLARCGQRSVTALVDISNYVMFEFGRPSHIFDLDKIHGGLHVRWGRKGETLELLNGNTITVDETVGVIADDQAVESLAGIMGGQATAVSDATKNIYVEAAFWWPEAVAGRSRRYAFSTDAGHRFERGVDPALTVEHIERITQLILAICGTPQTTVGPMDDQTLRLPERRPVTLRTARAARVIGMPLTQADCEQVLQRLALPYTAAPGLLTVTPPSWRFDLAIEEDLIEEVIRVHGVDKLPDTAPIAPVQAKPQTELRRSAHALRHALAALDYQETLSFSFVEEASEHELAGNADPIRVLNPIAAPLAVMRSSLIGSLVGALQHNLHHKAARVRLFEVGRVFKRDAKVTDGPLTVAGIDQPMRVAGLAYGPVDALQWGRKERAVDFFDVKGDVEALLAPRRVRFVPATHPALHPGRCARVELEGVAVGHVGELHPRWRQARGLFSAPVVFELGLAAVLGRTVPAYAPVPRQQAAQRDLSLVGAESVAHDALMATVAKAGGALVRAARLYDIYKPASPTPEIGAGERSLTLRLDLLDPDATLTDARIDEVVAAVVEALRASHGMRLRG
jgi:phenylalanyl-tRNA synthetase beta chain